MICYLLDYLDGIYFIAIEMEHYTNKKALNKMLFRAFSQLLKLSTQ